MNLHTLKLVSHHFHIGVYLITKYIFRLNPVFHVFWFNYFRCGFMIWIAYRYIILTPIPSTMQCRSLLKFSQKMFVNGNRNLGVPNYLVMANSMARAEGEIHAPWEMTYADHPSYFIAVLHQHSKSKGRTNWIASWLARFSHHPIICGSPQPRNILFLCAFALVTDAYGELWVVRCFQCPDGQDCISVQELIDRKPFEPMPAKTWKSRCRL